MQEKPEDPSPLLIAENNPPVLFETTLLMCDIRGFTKLLEISPPEEAFLFIENFLAKLAQAVRNHGGEINNLTGDGFLAQFAVDLFDGEHAARAVNAAIEIRNAVNEINQQRHTTKNATISVGIGIHTGSVAGGTIRLPGLNPFLLIGDAVNVTARIESLTKVFSVDVLISEETHRVIQGRFSCIPMATQQVKGKKNKLSTFWLPPTSKKVSL